MAHIICFVLTEPYYSFTDLEFSAFDNQNLQKQLENSCSPFSSGHLSSRSSSTNDDKLDYDIFSPDNMITDVVDGLIDGDDMSPVRHFVHSDSDSSTSAKDDAPFKDDTPFQNEGPPEFDDFNSATTIKLENVSPVPTNEDSESTPRAPVFRLVKRGRSPPRRNKSFTENTIHINEPPLTNRTIVTNVKPQSASSSYDISGFISALKTSPPSSPNSNSSDSMVSLPGKLRTKKFKVISISPTNVPNREPVKTITQISKPAVSVHSSSITKNSKTKPIKPKMTQDIISPFPLNQAGSIIPVVQDVKPITATILPSHQPVPQFNLQSQHSSIIAPKIETSIKELSCLVSMGKFMKISKLYIEFIE